MGALSKLDGLVSGERVRVYSCLLVCAYLIAAVWSVVRMEDRVDPLGKPLGYDFIAFYAASDLIRHADAAKVYDPQAAFDAAAKAVPANRSVYPFFYPPPFELLITPLAYMPYALALLVWTALGLGLYVLMASQLSRQPWAPVVALAFPAVFLCAMHGQNGFLTAAILGFGLLMLDRRPILAGVLLGLMIYKPHFAVLLPLLLLVQGRWKTIVSAGASATAVCAASVAAFGLAPWQAFIDHLPLASTALEKGWAPWVSTASIFVAAADLGVPIPAAYTVHGLVAVILAALTLWAWRGPGEQRLKIALAIPAIAAVSPYGYNYDLVLLAIPIGILADEGLKRPLPAGSLTLLIIAFLSPLAFTSLAQFTPLHLMPVANILLFACAWRVLRPPATAARPAYAQPEAPPPILPSASSRT